RQAHVEIGLQNTEVGNIDSTIAIDVAILPMLARLIEVRLHNTEVTDIDSAVQIDVATQNRLRQRAGKSIKVLTGLGNSTHAAVGTRPGQRRRQASGRRWPLRRDSRYLL